MKTKLYCLVAIGLVAEGSSPAGELLTNLDVKDGTLNFANAAAVTALNPVAAKVTINTRQQVLEEFVKLAAADETLVSLLAKHRLTLQCTLTDLRLDFYIGFDGVKVVGGVGRSPRPCDLALVSDSAALDKWLRGDENVSGMDVVAHLNLLRKVSLQRDLNALRKALTRVYTRACANATPGGHELAILDKSKQR